MITVEIYVEIGWKLFLVLTITPVSVAAIIMGNLPQNKIIDNIDGERGQRGNE